VSLTFPLDFRAEESVSVARKDAPMTPNIANRAIAAFTQEIRNRLDDAAKAAQAAEACANSGVPDQAVMLLLDIEQPVYEATTLLNAVSLIHRMQRE
jgi:hypothetical protein